MDPATRYTLWRNTASVTKIRFFDELLYILHREQKLDLSIVVYEELEHEHLTIDGDWWDHYILLRINETRSILTTNIRGISCIKCWHMTISHLYSIPE